MLKLVENRYIDQMAMEQVVDNELEQYLQGMEMSGTNQKVMYWKQTM